MKQNTISLTYGAKYKNYPFYNWVPKPLGIILLILLFIPILTVGGVYTANSGEMTSGLGIQSEHIQFVGFVTSVGMAAFSPFFYQLVCIRREKMMCVVGFSLMYLLSHVCAITDSIFVLALCSLIMGFLRMVLMMVNLFSLIRYAFGMEATQNITPGNEPVDEEGWDRLDSEKSKSMPIIYLFFMILGQLGTSLTAWLAYEYQWQDVYYYMMCMTLVAILIVLVTMPYHTYNNRRFPITFRKFGNVAGFSAMKDKISDLEITYPDSVFVTLRHQNGVKGMLAVDVVSPKAVRNFECFGDGLHLFWEGNPRSLYEFDKQSGEKRPVNTYARVEQDPRYSDNIVENAYVDELANFLGVLAGAEKPRYSFEQDKETIRLIEAIERA